MAEKINILASIILRDEYIGDFDGMAPEDIAYYFIENLQSDFDGLGIEFEMLEVF